MRKNTGQPSLPFDEGWSPPQSRVTVSHKSKLMFVLKPSVPLSLAMHGDAALHAANQNSRKEAYPAHLLHMTLLCMEGFDEPPRKLIEKTRMVAAGIRARPLPITLDSSGMFGGKRHLALYPAQGNFPVVQFSRVLGRALRGSNLPSFKIVDATPHVTLIYGCGRIETLPITRNYAWIAGEFMLVYSHHGETRHEEFGRWSLDPDAAAYPTPPEQLRLKV